MTATLHQIVSGIGVKTIFVLTSEKWEGMKIGNQYNYQTNLGTFHSSERYELYAIEEVTDGFRYKFVALP